MKKGEVVLALGFENLGDEKPDYFILVERMDESKEQGLVKAKNLQDVPVVVTIEDMDSD